MGTDPAWLPGTANLLQGEADRSRNLARALDDIASDLRRVDPERWTGDAHDAFVVQRDAQARQCRAAAVAHEIASRALGQYVLTLVALAESRRYAPPDALASLESERAAAASHAAAMLLEAAEELAVLCAKMPEVAADVTASAERRRAEMIHVDTSRLDTRYLQADPDAYFRQAQELLDAGWDRHRFGP
jgi:uncharacterized protein YukE